MIAIPRTFAHLMSLAGDLGDSLCVDVLVIHLVTKSQGGKDSYLPAGIITFHIRLGIALRITQSLGVLQGTVKIGTVADSSCVRM